MEVEMKCSKEGCNNDAQEYSAYCSMHQPNSSSQSRIYEDYKRKEKKEDKSKNKK